MWRGRRELRPLLLRRFPRATAGGSRTGAFVRLWRLGDPGSRLLPVRQQVLQQPAALRAHRRFRRIAGARRRATVDELAFALGALAHYANDIAGHPEAVNRSVPMISRSCARSSATTVTYVQAPKQHVIVEFSFDVAQTARGRYSFTAATSSLLDFQVATRAARARVPRHLRPRDGRRAGRPGARDLDLPLRGQPDDSGADRGGLARQARRDPGGRLRTPIASNVVFVYQPVRLRTGLTGANYQKPARFARFLAWSTVWCRRLVRSSRSRSRRRRRTWIGCSRTASPSRMRASRRCSARCGAAASTSPTPTSTPASRRTRIDYALADETHAEWLEELAKRDFAGATPQVRRTLDAFYRNAPAPDPHDRKARKAWERVQAALARLDSASSQTAQRRDRAPQRRSVRKVME